MSIGLHFLTRVHVFGFGSRSFCAYERSSVCLSVVCVIACHALACAWCPGLSEAGTGLPYPSGPSRWQGWVTTPPPLFPLWLLLRRKNGELFHLKVVFLVYIMSQKRKLVFGVWLALISVKLIQLISQFVEGTWALEWAYIKGNTAVIDTWHRLLLNTADWLEENIIHIQFGS